MFRVITLVLLSIIICGQIFAVSPPENDSQLPEHIKKAMRLIEDQNEITGTARLLQDIKLEKMIALEKGLSYQSIVVSGVTPVILGSYNDEAQIFTASDFQEHLFGVNPTGSMVDYYNEISYGQFQLSGTAYGAYTADQNKAYYASIDNGLDGTVYPQNAAGFIVSILGDADLVIDFSQFDNDGPDGIPNSGDDDGFVDALTVVFPGGGGNGPDPTNIWPHAWSLTGAGGPVYVSNDASANGGFIQLNSYTVNPAESGDGSLDVIKEISVFCHEYGHVLGITDLYDRSYETRGIGSWGLMGYSGSQGPDKPVHMSAWSKIELGWIVPIEVNSAQSITLPPVETNPTVYKVWADGFKNRDYFLLENRTATGFDINIKGQGLIVWHINENILSSYNWYSNPNKRLVDVVEADGLDDLDNMVNVMDSSDPFPGEDNVTILSHDTYPSSNDANGDSTGLLIDNIAYVSGPGSDVTCNITPRVIHGYTLTYHPEVDNIGMGWGTSASKTICYGAVKFFTQEAGALYSVSAAVKRYIPNSCEVRVFEDVVGSSSLDGLISTNFGQYPDYLKDQFMDITLDKLSLSSGQSFVIDCSWGPDYYAINLADTPPVSLNSFKSYDGIDYSTVLYYDVMLEAKIATDCNDTDSDNLCAFEDNCPTVYNPNQEDLNSDNIGDACCCVLRGDVNIDATLGISDLTYYVDFLFNGGPAPTCYGQGDINNDEIHGISDLTYFVEYLFNSGPAPAACP